MNRLALSISIITLVTIKWSFSNNPLRANRKVYKESMCVLIDSDGHYDIESFENSSIKFSNILIGITKKSEGRKLSTKFNESFTVRSNERHRFFIFFYYNKIEKVYDLLKNGIFDDYIMESKNNMEVEYYNNTQNPSQLAIVFYNLKNGTTLYLPSFNVSKISIGYNSIGAKIEMTDWRNYTWSSLLPGYLLLHIKINRNSDLVIHDMGSAIILSKECLEVCPHSKSPYDTFQSQNSNNYIWRNKSIGRSINTRHNTYELQRDLTAEYRQESIVIYTTFKDQNNLGWLNKIYQSPWYYLEFPGYSIINLVSICNDIKARDCYKINLEQTFTNETLISFIILQENKNNRLYIFEKYEEDLLVLNEINIPQIKLISSIVFNESIENYQILNHMNIVLKDCNKNRHILQAFNPLKVAIHPKSICIVEKTGKYKVVCESEELTQFVDIKVTNVNATNGTSYRELTSVLYGNFQPLTDAIWTNYSLFKRHNIYGFINFGLEAYLKDIGIVRDKVISINFETYANLRSRTIIELSTINIHTAQLETIYVRLSFFKLKAIIKISNATIRIKTSWFGFEIDDDKYDNRILYHISYRTDDMYVKPNISNYGFNLITKIICY